MSRRLAKPAPTFIGVPTEIRLTIYKHLFAPTSNQPLRRLGDIQEHHSSFNISILRINLKIHNEALPEFYASHTFHYTLISNGEVENCINTAYLPLVKHISLDTVCHSNQAGDEILATHLQILTKSCTALKTLTLHFLPKVASYGALNSAVSHLSSKWATKTIPILRTLQPRLHRLSIITLGSTRSLAWFRSEINNNKKRWGAEKHEYWPKMSLSVRQQLCLSGEGRRGAVCGWSIGNRFYAKGMEISSFHIRGKS